jgi:hypothetical protein
MFTSPSGSILTPDQAQELDDEFFQSMPLDYFHSRIASLIGSSGTSSSLTTTLAAHFARALGVDDPSTLLNCSASSRELQVAIDSFALCNHAAEAIVRLYHALAVTADRDDPAPCVWARIADGPRRTIDLIQQSRAHLGGDGHGSFWALVLPASAATATASEQDRFNTALNVMAFWCKTLVGDTGFEPVTSSVSVISGTPDNAAAGVNGVRRCTPMIAGCCSD